MAKFHGDVGYGDPVEAPSGSGKWKDVMTERPYYGDVTRNTRRLEPGETLNSDILVDNTISIMSDEHAIKHFFKIKYVRWAGVRWTVTNVEVKPPRLILSLGSVYNGPTP